MFATRTDVDVIAAFRQRTRPRGGSWAALATAAIVALALALAAFVQSSPGRQVTRDLGLFAPSEPFTELYFSDPGAVATATQSAPVRAPRRESVAFVIHNASHHALTYRWSVHVRSARHGVGAAVGSAGTTRLRAGRAATIHRRVRTGCATADHASQPSARPTRRSRTALGRVRVRVTVALSKPAESIGYWVRCRG